MNDKELKAIVEQTYRICFKSKLKTKIDGIDEKMTSNQSILCSFKDISENEKHQYIVNILRKRFPYWSLLELASEDYEIQELSREEKDSLFNEYSRS